MAELHWDLTQAATRAALLDQTLAQLPVEARETALATAEGCGIPDAHCHSVAEVDAAIDAAALSDRVKADAHAIYRILAEAEAAAHGCALEQTHFHEVGNGARIRNAVALCCAIETLAPERITATAVQTGSGTVQCAHGELSIPAPATAAIIARGIPVCAEKLEGELLTPTSAAMILHFVDAFE